MKKIISLFSIALLTLSCSQAQQTEFKKEALENVMVSSANDSITFQEILKKYEGKTIVIDIWASWCSDCIAGMPKVKALQQQFPDATYLFISMDKNYAAWTKVLQNMIYKENTI
jgi:thiol-disulfide isomerase/thioredoxin